MSTPLKKLIRDTRIDLVLSRLEKEPSLIEEIIRYLNDESRSIRFNSILILGELGQKSSSALSQLITCLEDEDWSICREAVRTLGKMGNAAEEAVLELSKLGQDEEISIRKEVAKTLGKIRFTSEESISTLIMALEDESEEVRLEAANSLGEIGPNAYNAIPALMKCLKDTDWAVRTSAAQSIGKIGRESTKSIPTLIKALNDRDWRVRNRVIDTLTQIGEEAIPSLLEVIDHKNPIVKKGVVEVLGEIGLASPEILAKLSILLQDKVEYVYGKAADALRSIGTEALPTLIGALKKSNIKRKIVILTAIGGIGPNAKDSIPDLVEIFKELNVFERKKIEKIEDKELSKSKLMIINIKNSLIRSIITFIKDPLSKKTKILVELSRILGKIGTESKEALSILCEALKDPKAIVRREAALALGTIGVSASDATPELIKLLTDSNLDVRWRASEALGKIGVNTTEVTDALENLLYDKYDLVSESAEIALDNLKEIVT